MQDKHRNAATFLDESGVKAEQWADEAIDMAAALWPAVRAATAATLGEHG